MKLHAVSADGPPGRVGAVRPAPPAASRGSGATVWITGLPAAGKTTLGLALARELSAAGYPVRVLDGDELRRDVCRDLGFDRAGRAEMAGRVARIASSLASAGTIVIVALVSPYAADRRAARELHAEPAVPFIEIFLDTPLAVCRRRDPKGLYARTQRGCLSGLTGIDDPYEQPDGPHLRLPVQTLELSVRAVLDALTECGALANAATHRLERSPCAEEPRSPLTEQAGSRDQSLLVTTIAGLSPTRAWVATSLPSSSNLQQLNPAGRWRVLDHDR